MIDVTKLPGDLCQKILRLSLKAYQYSQARVIHRRAMNLIRPAAKEMDKGRHVIYFTDGKEPASSVELWHNSVLTGSITPANIDFKAQATFETLEVEEASESRLTL